VDDNETTFSKNKKNAVYIPPYEVEPTVDALETYDNALLQLKYFLILPHVVYTNDFTKINLSSIFKYSVEDYKQIANSYYDDIN